MNELKLDIAKLPELVKQHPIPYSTLILYGSSTLVFVGFCVGVGVGEYFTPLYTNSFSFYYQWIAQMLFGV